MLELDDGAFGGGFSVVEGEVGGAVDKEVVVVGLPTADPPPDPAVEEDAEGEDAGGDVTVEGVAEVGRDGDFGADEDGRP